MKRMLFSLVAGLSLAGAAALPALADGPQAPTVVAVPQTRVIDGIVLALPPGYGGVPDTSACLFAVESGGGVLAIPAGYGGGTATC